MAFVEIPCLFDEISEPANENATIRDVVFPLGFEPPLPFAAPMLFEGELLEVPCLTEGGAANASIDISNVICPTGPYVEGDSIGPTDPISPPPVLPPPVLPPSPTGIAIPSLTPAVGTDRDLGTEAPFLFPISEPLETIYKWQTAIERSRSGPELTTALKRYPSQHFKFNYFGTRSEAIEEAIRHRIRNHEPVLIRNPFWSETTCERVAAGATQINFTHPLTDAHVIKVIDGTNIYYAGLIGRIANGQYLVDRPFDTTIAAGATVEGYWSVIPTNLSAISYRALGEGDWNVQGVAHGYSAALGSDGPLSELPIPDTADNTGTAIEYTNKTARLDAIDYNDYDATPDFIERRKETHQDKDDALALLAYFEDLQGSEGVIQNHRSYLMPQTSNDYTTIPKMRLRDDTLRTMRYSTYMTAHYTLKQVP